MKTKHIITWLCLIVILITVITQNTLKTKKEREQVSIKQAGKSITSYNTVVLISN